MPKPFIRLQDGQSLLQKTLLRALRLPGVKSVLTVTNRDHYFLTRDEYSELPSEGIVFDYLLEPLGRNTAAAVAVASLHLARTFAEDVIVLAMPADHLIQDHETLARAVDAASALAAEGWLVTFGIEPAYAETGYGYIERGEALQGTAGFAVRRFVEKPGAEVAKGYVESGRFLWNSGMFCFAAGAMNRALRTHAPDVFAAAEAALEASDLTQTPVVLDAGAFALVPDISIDRAVMERSDRVAVVPGGFDWGDIGSWNALAELVPADGNGNRVAGDAILIDTKDTFIQSDSRMVAALGIDNLVVIDTPDALLIAERGRVQDVKAVVDQLRLVGHDTVRHHRTVNRPWGTYTVLEEGERFKIKRIVVRPGASLSLQRHQHRSEHWVVVSGVAKVVNGTHELVVSPNESTYIPPGTAHRLMNPGTSDCVMIEVQVGAYLGEDDIVRLEDCYGRLV